jgi:hypothetical protein
MKAIDEIGFKRYAASQESGEFLINIINSPAEYSSLLTFSNNNQSDYVLAHVGRDISIVDKEVPYNDFEIKMNIALKKMQNFDFNSPAYYFFPKDVFSTRSRTTIESYIAGLHDWETIYYTLVQRQRENFIGRMYISNSIAIHKVEDSISQFAKIMFAPVVRLDKFGEFRRNSMFRGDVKWSANVIYWINEDLLYKSEEEGRLYFLKAWRNFFYRGLKDRKFRIEIVPNSEFNKLIHAPISSAIKTIPKLREEASKIVIESRNAALVVNKGEIIQRMQSMNIDFLSRFTRSEVVAIPEVVIDTDDEPIYQAPAPAPSIPAGRGILEQINEATNGSSTYNSNLTVEDISRVVGQLIEGQAIVDREAGRPPVDYNSSFITNRRFGRTALRRAEQQSAEQLQALEPIIAEIRRLRASAVHGQITDFTDLIAIHGQEQVDLALSVIYYRTRIQEQQERAQSLMRQYPLTEEDAFMLEQPIGIMPRDPVVRRIDPIDPITFREQQFLDDVREMTSRMDSIVGIPPLHFSSQLRTPQVQDDMAIAARWALASQHHIARGAADELYMQQEESEEQQLQREASDLQRTLETQQNDNTNESNGPTSQVSEDNDTNVFGGDSADSEEDAEIF